jgi:tetratricopeptide (TPR) repeat protein/DNA-binding XRE family transcriptional regulator
MGRNASFGDLLRRHRAVAKLTQEGLADRTGLSTAAISALERGVRHGPRVGTVELLARALGLGPADRREFEAAARERRLPEQAVPPEPRAGIPPDPIVYFLGRDAELAELEGQLQATGRVAIHGLGGVGKTQLAIRYLHRHRAAYPDGVFWLRADEEASLVVDLASLAWHLALPERELPQLERQVEAVLRRLREARRWLLVLDNVEPAAQGALERWLPPGLGGHLLATSRTPMWLARLGLGPLPPACARELLLVRSGQRDAGAADAVAESLGYLPLALSQAAGYLEASGRDLASYADLLRTRLVELMSEAPPEDYPRPVATTWRLSLERLAAERPPAASLLNLCAFLAPDDIPVGLLRNGDGLGDELELDRAIAALRQYSLVERNGDSLRVHRLVQAVVRETIGPGPRADWLGSAIRLLGAALAEKPHGDPAHWDVYARLLPHVQLLESLPETPVVDPVALSRVLRRVGSYAFTRGQFELADSLLRRALAVSESELGPDHLDTAQSLINLAIVLTNRGRPAAALPLNQRALAIRERALGPDHPDTAESLNGLAAALMAQLDFEAARPLLERCLAIYERTKGPDDGLTTVCLNNLARVLQAQDDLTAAAALHERALGIRERTWGADHPLTAVSLGNLGSVRLEQGELGAARSLQERALAIFMRVQGPEHLSTAQSLELLALTMWRQGELAAAGSALQRALTVYENTLPPDHPRLARCRGQIAEILRSDPPPGPSP